MVRRAAGRRPAPLGGWGFGVSAYSRRPEEALSFARFAASLEGHLEVEEFTLLFKSSREFFFAPVIEYGPLTEWKEIAGEGQEMQDVFWFIKEAIDAYWGDRPFQVTVKAGCLIGKKLEPPPPEPSSPMPVMEDTSPFTRQTGEAHWHVLMRARAIETGSDLFSAPQGGRHGKRRGTQRPSPGGDPRAGT